MSGISMQSLNAEDYVGGNWDGQYDRNREVFGMENFSFVQHKDYALKFLKKRAPIDTGPQIPARKREILSYFRAFYSSSMKSQLFFVGIFDFQFNWHIWTYLFKCFFIHIPTAYMILFLSVYAEEQYFYSERIFPLFSGCSLQIVMAGIFELAFHSEMILLALDYMVLGIFDNNPWNRCEELIYEIDGDKVSCHELDVFYNKTNNNETQFLYSRYSDNHSDFFQSSHIIYFFERTQIKQDDQIGKSLGIFTFYYCAIWTVAILFYDQLYKKYIWRIIDFAMWILTGIYFMTLLYIEMVMHEEVVSNLRPRKSKDQFVRLLQSSELAILINSPPILHFIYTRSNYETHPGWDSSIYGLTTIIFKMFQDMTYNRLLKFCETKAGIYIQASVYHSYPLFYLWPMFFEFFTLGPFYIKLFFVTLFLVEFFTLFRPRPYEEVITFTKFGDFASIKLFYGVSAGHFFFQIITYLCLVEVITSRLPKCKLLIAILISSICIALKFAFSAETRTLLYIYGKVITWVTEIVVIYIFYPLNRLIEDMLFYYYDKGISGIRKCTLQFMPAIYIGICVKYLLPFHDEYAQKINKSNTFDWIWMVPLIPLVLGAVYAVAKFVIRQKQGIMYLFLPEPSWGPQEHIVRQFRKKFDSRFYIDSLGPRYLNRHMLNRAEAKTYQLGVQYNLKRKNSSDLKPFSTENDN